MAGIKMTVTRVQVNTGRVAAAEKRAALRGARDGADFILAQSQRLVPIDKTGSSHAGTLLRTGRVVPTGDGGYGVQYSTVYARRQHYEDDWRHLPGRSSRYIERPAAQYASEVFASIARELRRAF